MANANWYHVTKFLFYLSFAIHYFYTQISSLTQLFIQKNCFKLFYLLTFYFAVYLKLNLSNNQHSLICTDVCRQSLKLVFLQTT